MLYERYRSTQPDLSAVDTSHSVDSPPDIPWPNVPDNLFDARAQWVPTERVRGALEKMAKRARQLGTADLPYSALYTPVVDALDRENIDWRPAFHELLRREPASVTPIGTAVPEPDINFAALESASGSTHESRTELDDDDEVERVLMLAACRPDLQARSASSPACAPAPIVLEACASALQAQQSASPSAPATPPVLGVAPLVHVFALAPPAAEHAATPDAEAMPATPETGPMAFGLERRELEMLRESGLTDAAISAARITTKRGNELAARVCRDTMGIKRFLASPRVNPRDKATVTTDETIAPVVGAVFPCAMPGCIGSPYDYRVRLRSPRAKRVMIGKSDAAYRGDGWKRDPHGDVEGNRYESPAGRAAPVYFPATSEGYALYVRSATWVATEGEKKAIALSMCGQAAIGLCGIYMGFDHDHVTRLAVEHLRKNGGDPRSKAELEAAKNHVKHSLPAQEVWRLHPNLKLLATHGGGISGKTLIIGFDHWLNKEAPAEPHAAVRFAATWFHAGGERVLFAFPRPIEGDMEPAPKGWDDLLVRAGLRAQGLMPRQHDLTVDAAEALDLDSGIAEVNRQLGQALELPRDVVCRRSEHEAVRWVQEHCEYNPHKVFVSTSAKLPLVLTSEADDRGKNRARSFAACGQIADAPKVLASNETSDDGPNFVEHGAAIGGIYVNGDAAEAKRDERRAEVAKLSELGELLLAANKLTAEQYALLATEVPMLAREIDSRFQRYRDLLIEHTPEHLVLNEDAAVAHILAARYGTQLRRVAGGWRAYDGKRWTTGGEADEIARGFVREIGELFSALARDAGDMIETIGKHANLACLLETAADEAGQSELGRGFLKDKTEWSKIHDDLTEDASSQNELTKVAERLTSARGINAALSVAETLPQLWATASSFDARHDLLNAANGVIDLRTGVLLTHDPSYMITQLCPHNYDPQARAPRWELFLEQVHPARDVRAYAARHWGYVLTGEMREQELQINQGPGGDGKSVEVDTIAYVLGPDYAKVATHGLLIDDQRGRSKDAQNAAVEGARLVMLPEWPRGGKIDLGHIKHITGGTSEVSANRMRENTYRYSPRFKIVVNANALPEINVADASRSLWTRIRLVRYSQTFRGTDRDDKGLIEELRGQATGILAWGVREAVAYYAEGLKVPSEVSAWVDEWRSTVNHIAAWIDERCETGSYLRCEGGRLFADYREWALGAGVEHPMSPSQFYAALSELGYKATASNQKRYRVGIQLRRDFAN